MTRLLLAPMRLGRPLGAVAAGVLSGPAEALLLLVAGLVWVTPPGRRRAGRSVAGHARRIAEWERRRLAFAASLPAPPPSRAGDPRVHGYLAARLLPAFLGALTCGLLAVGAVLAGIVSVAFVTGQMTVLDLVEQTLLGCALLALNLQAMASVARLDRWLAHTLLESGTREELQQRITELTATRAGVIAAVDAERRRIERDLHDGLQQRLVALGMLLGRARRGADPEQAARLITQAHHDAQRAIDELREVAWRVYPSALDHGTLDDALSMVARQSVVPVRIAYRPADRPPPPVETVLYFVACEGITNAAKHSGATVIDIEITGDGKEAAMVLRDDGTGGADASGSGLQGLARRVAALDGRFDLHSPPGAGTTIRVSLPCA